MRFETSEMKIRKYISKVGEHILIEVSTNAKNDGDQMFNMIYTIKSVVHLNYTTPRFVKENMDRVGHYEFRV